LYDASTPEVRKWMHDNVGEWWKKTRMMIHLVSSLPFIIYF